MFKIKTKEARLSAKCNRLMQKQSNQFKKLKVHLIKAEPYVEKRHVPSFVKLQISIVYIESKLIGSKHSDSESAWDLLQQRIKITDAGKRCLGKVWFASEIHEIKKAISNENAKNTFDILAKISHPKVIMSLFKTTNDIILLLENF